MSARTSGRQERYGAIPSDGTIMIKAILWKKVKKKR